LANGTSDLSHKFSIFYGIWACHYVRGEVSEQRKAALEFLAEAERHNNTAALCVAHRTIGTTCFTMGEFAQALPHLKRARALYDGTKHVNYRYQYGQDIGVAALCYLSCALWHLGYADQAQEAAAEAIKCAEYVTHPLTLVYALCHAGFLMDVFRRHDKEMQPCAATVISLCGENGFPHWKSGGRILEGWAQVVHGRVHEGREKICSAVLDWRRGGARLWVPLFLMGQAQAHARAGDGHAALASIEEALAVVEVTGERWALAEVLRVKAGLLRDAAQNRTDEIETILVNSLEIARRQGARFWELRTACDLARLWQQQGRDTKGFELLGSIYDQFTEGFNTADMQDAKALIKSLRAAPLAKSLRMTKRVAGSTTNHKRAKARRDSRNGEFDERANGVAHSAAKRRDEREFPPKRR
jgi:predicted ATPase